MYTIANQKSNNTPRFKNFDSEIVYKLFDAFVQTTLVDNKAIDFSKPMVAGENGSLAFVPREENFTNIINGMCQEPALLSAHLNWLWTLGMTNSNTTCGKENAAALNIAENGDAFNGKIGLWKIRLIPSNKKKDLCFIESALKRFATWPNKPTHMTLSEAKTYLAQIAFKVKNTLAADMRHGLLHLCDPDTYICLYTQSEKVEAVKLNENVLVGESLTSRTFGPAVYEGYSVNYKDVKAGYDADLTEEKLCRLYDILSGDAAVQDISLQTFINKKLLKIKE